MYVSMIHNDLLHRVNQFMHLIHFIRKYVRNNGQYLDMVSPFWHFVKPQKVWVDYLAEYYLKAYLIHTQ